jgi:hypothetical protein
MPLDPDVAIAAPQADFADSWDADRVLLYHIGLGAGARATDPAELAYVNERYLASSSGPRWPDAPSR